MGLLTEHKTEEVWYLLYIFRHLNQSYFTGCKPVRQFSLPAETVHHIWLPPRLSTISCFLHGLPSLKNVFLPRLSALLCFLPRASAGSRIMQTVSAGSHFIMYRSLSRKQEIADSLSGSQIWRTVSAGNWRTGLYPVYLQGCHLSFTSNALISLGFFPWCFPTFHNLLHIKKLIILLTLKVLKVSLRRLSFLKIYLFSLSSRAYLLCSQ